jgi:hypothetical protein
MGIRELVNAPGEDSRYNEISKNVSIWCGIDLFGEPIHSELAEAIWWKKLFFPS